MTVERGLETTSCLRRKRITGIQSMDDSNTTMGKNPDWPQKILDAEYEGALAMFEATRNDTRDVETIIADNQQPPQFVLTKGVDAGDVGVPRKPFIPAGFCGRPYVTSIQTACVPVCPRGCCCARSISLGSDVAGVQLANLNRTETRNVVIQAGAFGEHQFTKVQFQETDGESSSERGCSG